MTEPDSSQDLIYVYGLLAPDALREDGARQSGAREDGACEDGAREDGAREEAWLGAGVSAAPVRLQREGALAALVSTVALGPVPQTRRNMLAHTAVLERVMAHATVLPVRFGTVAPDPRALARCIAGNSVTLREALRAIDGRVELGVKASWQAGVIYRDILAADDDLRRLRDRLHSRPCNETYYERVELGRRVETALAERRRIEAAAITAKLSALAEREAELRTLDEDMILNRAFLIPRKNESRFDHEMEMLAKSCDGRVTLRYVGPVPPYNFVRLKADWLAAAA